MITLADVQKCYAGFEAVFGYKPDALAVHPSDYPALWTACWGPLVGPPPPHISGRILGMQVYQTEATPPGKIYMTDQAMIEDWIDKWKQRDAVMDELARMSQEMGYD